MNSATGRRLDETDVDMRAFGWGRKMARWPLGSDAAHMPAACILFVTKRCLLPLVSAT